MSDPLNGFSPKDTYNAASLDYEQGSRAFWGQISSRTVALASPVSGESVLDVACGTGPSVIGAAMAVGPDGHVLGIDYSDQMLAIAHEKVRAEDLRNVELRTGDMTELALSPASFDVVLCVLGLFFVEDMPALVRSLWRLLRPGGRLAIAVLGEMFFSPMLDVFVEAVREERPDLDVIEPWRRTRDPDTLRAIMRAAGVTTCEISSEVDVISVVPSDWWRIVMGTGLRRTATALGPNEALMVRGRCEQYMRDHSLDKVELSSRYVIAVAT